jgi:hypothetical protein
VCDLSYATQRDEIMAGALAQTALAPHAKHPGSIPTPDTAVAEFDEWLAAPPPSVSGKASGQLELEDLIYRRR